MLSSFKEGSRDERSNDAPSLTVFVSVVVRGVIEVFTYANNGEFLEGVLEADGLLFGILGNFSFGYC